MIGFFPAPYPDELLYSVLARYYGKSGYLSYTSAANDLFADSKARPDAEFLNPLTPDAYASITRTMPVEYIVIKHTMFPYYGRFLKLEQRRQALEAIAAMKTNIRNFMGIPKSREGEGRYLRYCPVCVDSDRKQYGETYWHRIHQMIGVNLCPYHLCRLVNSSLTLSRKASPMLIPAEESAPCQEKPIFSENRIEYQASRYIAAVFHAKVDMQSDIDAGSFLHSQMAGTKYLSRRGEQRNISLLYKDLTEYYSSLPRTPFTEAWRLQKVFTNDCRTTYEICLAAMFLGVSTADLTHMKLPEKSQEQLFDEEVHRLRREGLKYPEIAQRLNASYDTVKAIGEKRYGTYHKTSRKSCKGGVKPLKWQEMDRDLLPKVKEIARQLQGDGNTRPRRVTLAAVEKLLGLPCKRIDKLVLCKAEIQKHYESQVEYWARETVWAAREMTVNDEPFNWRHLRAKTNMRKRDFLACLPYLSQFADTALCEKIRSLLA